jgi:putative endonuclease
VWRVSYDVRQHLGRLGEQLAAEHLERLGYQVLDRNYRTRWGELDIVGYDGAGLVFCEVKTRRLPHAAGHPFEAVDARKRTQLRKMAARWLIERQDRPYARELRFDAVGVTVDGEGHLVDLEHIRDAF